MATTRNNVATFTTDNESRAVPPPVPYALLFIIVGVIVPSLIAYGLGTINETQIVAIVLAVLGMWGMVAQPFFGLVVFCALLYTRPEESIPALAGMHFTLMVAIITLIGMLLHMMLHRVPLIHTPLVGFMTGFVLCAILSGAVAGTTSEAVMDFCRLLVLILLILNLVRTPERYQILVTALIVFTCYVALYSIYLYMTGVATIDNGTAGGLARSKGTGIFSDPNDLAATIVAGFALTMTRVLQARSYKRLFYLLLIGAMMWAILLTNSRGGLLALITVIGCFCLVFSRRKALAITAAIAFMGIVLVAAPGRMKNFDSGEESANSRFIFWQEGLRQLQANPVTGVGYLKFPDVNGGFVAHNSFVNCFAELGFPGFFFWMGCLYMAFRRRSCSGGGEEKTVPDSLEAKDLIGARLALVGYLSAAFWITRTYAPNLYILLSLPVAQQISTSKEAVPQFYTDKERSSVYGRVFLLCLGMLVVIRIMVEGK